MTPPKTGIQQNVLKTLKIPKLWPRFSRKTPRELILAWRGKLPNFLQAFQRAIAYPCMFDISGGRQSKSLLRHCFCLGYGSETVLAGKLDLNQEATDCDNLNCNRLSASSLVKWVTCAANWLRLITCFRFVQCCKHACNIERSGSTSSDSRA